MRRLSSVDKEKLVALVQSQQPSDDDDCELSLAAATYKSHSSDAVGVPIDFLDEAQATCDHTRHADSIAAHSCDAQAVSRGTTSLRQRKPISQDLHQGCCGNVKALRKKVLHANTGRAEAQTCSLRHAGLDKKSALFFLSIGSSSRRGTGTEEVSVAEGAASG